MQPIYETNSDNTSEMDNESNLTTEYTTKSKVEELKNFYQGSSIKKNTSQLLIQEENLSCKLCKDDCNQFNFIILSCNHIFHIGCLAETYFKNIYNYDILDEEYFNNTKCTTCFEKLEQEEIMYLYGKFLSNTKSLIKNHQNSIDHLENQLKKIKDELRTCYDYKHKLEKQKEKSKQIVSILNTMI